MQALAKIDERLEEIKAVDREISKKNDELKSNFDRDKSVLIHFK